MKIAALALAMTTIFTLSPFVAALGYKTAVIAKHEAIFNCLFSQNSSPQQQWNTG